MIRLLQILLPDAPPRARRMQALDGAALAGRADVVAVPLRRAGTMKHLRDALASSRAEVAHVYGPPLLPGDLLAAIDLPLVAAGAAHRS
ncbi:MAG TPA: hypothetical protein VGF40_13405, partial [Thermoanaerobaculia bacterium]